MTNRLAFAHFCSAARREGALAFCLALCTLGLGLSGSAREPSFTTIDVTGASTTYAVAINPSGTIVGYYATSGVHHGYVRAPDGTITPFDATGAGTLYGQGTVPYGLNPEGAIVGSYYNSSFELYPFLRAPDGTFTPLTTLYTYAVAINPEGTIAGWYNDVSAVAHGYVRAPDGTVTPIDAPWAGTGADEGTSVAALNPAGAITGE